jgi:hypothetical protein
MTAEEQSAFSPLPLGAMGYECLVRVLRTEKGRITIRGRFHHSSDRLYAVQVLNAPRGAGRTQINLDDPECACATQCGFRISIDASAPGENLALRLETEKGAILEAAIADAIGRR